MGKPAASTISLLGAAGALAVIAVWYAQPSEAPHISTEMSRKHEADAETASEAAQWAFQVPAENSFTALKEAPIFHATRSFHVAPKVPPSKQVAKKALAKPKPVDPKTILSRMILVGTVMDGSVQKAVLKRTPSAESEVMKTGDTLNGWKIGSISDSAIHFVSNGDTFALKFPDTD